MLLEVLFKLILGIANLFISLIPELNINFEMPDTTFFNEMLGIADYFFPVGTLIAALSTILIVQNAQFFIKVFQWLWKKMPFVG